MRLFRHCEGTECPKQSQSADCFAGPIVRHRKTKRPSAAQPTGVGTSRLLAMTMALVYFLLLAPHALAEPAFSYTVDNYIGEFLELWYTIRGLPYEEQFARWRDDYVLPRGEWFKEYIYLHPEVTSLDTFTNRHALLNTRRTSLAQMDAALPQLIDEVTHLFAEAAGPLHNAPHIVLLPGLFAREAWVDRSGEQPTIILAPEMFRTQEGLTLYLAHELAHLFWDEQIQAAAQLEAKNANVEHFLGSSLLAEMLITEGFATLASEQVLPNFPLEFYFWADMVEHPPLVPYGIQQRFVDDCQAQLAQAIDLVLANWQHPSEEVVTQLFGVTTPPARFPPRIGYYVGYLLVRRWMDERPLERIWELPIRERDDILLRLLQSMKEKAIL